MSDKKTVEELRKDWIEKRKIADAAYVAVAAAAADAAAALTEERNK